MVLAVEAVGDGRLVWGKTDKGFYDYADPNKLKVNNL